MKKLTAILLYFSIALLSCGNPDKGKATGENDTTETEPKPDTGKLNDYLSRHETPSQKFSISSSKPTQIKGKKGTIVYIDPANLETLDGKPVGKNIDIELKELHNQGELLRSNAQTVSNGRLLVSGGAYYINMQSGGQQLRLKEGKTLSIEFPKISDKEMALFYGERNSLGQLNWIEANEKLVAEKAKSNGQPAPRRLADTTSGPSDFEALFDYIAEGETDVSEEEKKEIEARQKLNNAGQKLYEAINIRSFGWINVDRFLEEDNRTDLVLNINPSDSINNASIMLIFKDINSIMQQYYFSGNNNNSISFKDLPVGRNIRVLAFTVKDEKPYAFASDLTISKDLQIAMVFKEVSEWEFERMLE